MSDQISKEDEELLKKELFLIPPQNKQELRDWIYTFLDIDIPFGNISGIDEAQESDIVYGSPGDAIWEAYETYKDDRYQTNPGYIWMANRDGAKTLAGSILNVLLICLFKAEVAHLAAVKKQAEKCIEYTNIFMRKIAPYLNHHGRKIISDSKHKIQVLNEDGSVSFIDVIVASLAGGNCVDPNSLVYTEFGPKKAFEIALGDKIKTWDYKNNQDVYVDVDGISLTHKPATEVIFDDGTNLVLSNDHLVFTKRGGWKTAASLRIGDLVTKSEGFEKKYIPSTVELLEEKIERSSEQILIGTLLGDASISSNGANRYRYQVSHSENHLDYIQVIKEVLEKAGFFCNEKLYVWEAKLTKRGINKSKAYGIATKTSLYIDSLKDQWYKNGKKIITKEMLDKLTYEGIAYWFMDDASGNYVKSGTQKDSAYSLAVCGFSLEEIEMISKWFNDKGYQNKISTVTNQSKKTYHVIDFTIESSRDLTEKIEYYFVNSYRYKLVPSKKESYQKTIDSDKNVDLKNSGLQISDQVSFFGSKHAKKVWYKNVFLKRMQRKVIAIKRIGWKRLVDIHIKTEYPHLRSFYVNGGVLVHNSQRAHVGSYDELDTLSKQGLVGYKEAQLIPTRKNNHGPMTVKYSTRKFSFGIFEKEIQNRHLTHEKLVQWNILDITEKCSDSRSLKNTGNVHIRYTKKQLPSIAITREELDKLKTSEIQEYKKIHLYDGCLKCPLAGICQGRLTKRGEEAKSGAGSIYKSVDFTIGQFRKTNNEMAEAQLLCWKATSAGLVYSRFSETLGDNVVTVQQAYELVTGIDNPAATFDDLVAKIVELGLPVYAGVDFGFTHDSTIMIMAVLPTGESLLLDTYGSPGLETHDFADIASEYNEKYNVRKWFCDQAAPAAIKTFSKKGMKCPDFKKDVMGGISAIRSQVVTTTAARKFKIVKTTNNESSIKMMKEHHFLLDNAGNVTTTPDDTIGVADRADALRYIGQNVFDSKTGKILISGHNNPKQEEQKPQPVAESANKVNEELMKKEISNKLGVATSGPSGNKKKGGLSWNF